MRQRIVWVDVIRATAMFFVVCLHTASPLLGQFGKIDFGDWQIANVYDSMMRMAVPLFFMITGVMLLNGREEPLPLFFKKRFFKVLIPLLVWSLLYILFRKYVLGQDIGIIKLFLSSLLWKSYYHLWFLYTIIGIYFFLPILRVFVNNASTSLKIYFVLLWAFVVSVLPLLEKFSGIALPNYLPMMAGYTGYLLLGHLLSKAAVTKRLFYLALFFAVAATSATVYGTAALSETADAFDDFFYGYFSVTTMVQAISYFFVLKYVAQTVIAGNEKTTLFFAGISKASLGIYLIHPMVLWILSEQTGWGTGLAGDDPLVTVPVTAVTAFMISYGCIFILQKIPVVRRSVP